MPLPLPTNRCHQILTATNNNITMATYRIFTEAQTDDTITAGDWDEFTAALGDGDKEVLEGVVGNLALAWMRSAPCGNLVALVKWRRGVRGLHGGI
jgi:hypothetical protein